MTNRSNSRPWRRIPIAVIAAAALLAPLGLIDSPESAGAATVPVADQDMRLWYDEPASAGSRIDVGGDSFGSTTENQIWQQRTLPIGNGNIGATVYGEIGKERLAFNEKSLWSGGPSASRPGYNGGNLEEKGRDGAALREVQDLFADGQTAQAQSLAQDSLIGAQEGYGAYEGYGEIGLDYGFDASGVTNYRRSLDLETATASVEFDKGGVHYTREFFASYPDNVMVAKLTASKAGALDVDVSLGFRLGGASTTVSGDTLTVSGALADNQLKHTAVVKAVPTGGTLSATGSALRVSDANEVLLYITASTDYADDYPVYRTGQSAEQLAAEVRGRADLAATDGYSAVRKRHLADYRELYARVHLQLGSQVASDPTDELLARYRASTASAIEKRTLEVTLYQYGRYLGIASSRQGTLPSNLQGIWADRVSGNSSSPVPWGSDYHMNVNLQMNYWPSYSANLPETATALVDYVEGLREPGRVTAEVYAGVTSTPENPENGFTAHTQNTPFGWTTPGWQFTWGWSPAAVPWILQNVYEYYEYTGDETYLRDVIYPMMREATKYYDQTLVEDAATGRLISSPTYSPEHGPITNGNFYEEQLIWQLYNDVIVAAQTLDVDAQLVQKWEATKARLDPVEVGASGQIKEWYEETTLNSVPGAQRNHRHLSQLLGLFPGDLISVETPEYLAAAEVSLNDRGDAATGWGIAQRLNAWARIGDGDRSLKIIEQLFRTGIYSNLFDTHPPFQIDGNFGYTSGVNEMLMQSNMGYVSILPALPSGWSSGQVDGILARGDFEIGIDWNDSRASKISVTSGSGGDFVGEYAGLSGATIIDADGGVIRPTVLTSDRVSFPTRAGHTYTISALPVAGSYATTPNDVAALRSSDTAVHVRWSSDSPAGTSYIVERSVADGAFTTVNGSVSGTTFTDESAAQNAGVYRYRVSAELGGVSSRPSAPAQVVDIRGAGIVDDRSPRISYTGGWANWEDAKHHDGTIKYIESTSGGESISMDFLGTGVSFISPTYSALSSVDFYIDGAKVSSQPYSLYSATSKVQQEHLIADGLPRGVHDLRVVVTGDASPTGGRKIEFDALRVLDAGIVPVQSIALRSETGATAIGSAGGTLQLVAQAVPANATNSNVSWSVSDSSIATVGTNGAVVAGSKNGTATVTATATDGSGVKSTIAIRVYGNPIEEVTIDDASSAITYSPQWKVWNQDARNLESTLHYVDDAVGAKAQHSFSGTGIDVYGTKNNTDGGRVFGTFVISVDGVPRSTVNLNDLPDSHRLRLASITGLSNGPHEIEITNARAAAGGLKAELDYLVVKSPLATADERQSLQAQLERAERLDEADYAAQDWATFRSSLASAVSTMNDADASESQLSGATSTLSAAIDELET
ncbi:glycoside hydrolase N-terminal domain-containing protein [Microbacteriaceae bacterium VKM Ac-2855]|nr:glycoside hydrolase N-terminal domain-containing protein [Microbacteriaceae bacterium VKM Ac-2855]